MLPPHTALFLANRLRTDRCFCCHELESPGSRRVGLCFGCCWRYCRDTHIRQQDHIPEAHRSLQSISKALQGKPPELVMLHYRLTPPNLVSLTCIGASSTDVCNSICSGTTAYSLLQLADHKPVLSTGETVSSVSTLQPVQDDAILHAARQQRCNGTTGAWCMAALSQMASPWKASLQCAPGQLSLTRTA